MTSMIQDLVQQLGGERVDQLSTAIGADRNATERAMMAAVPLLMGSLASNTHRAGGAQALAGALDRDHDGSILDDVAGFLGSGATGPGAGILRHVLGEKQTVAAAQVGKASGLDTGSAMKLLAMVAPLVLGALGKTKRREGLGERDLSDLLGREQRQAAQTLPGGLGGLASFLDADGDGEVLDDAARLGAGMLRSFLKR